MIEKLSPDQAYARVKALDAERGLVWLAPSKVDNTYALAMRRADAATKGISSISDLARRVQAGDVFRLASTVEFITRADGLKPLEQAYGFQFGYGDVVGMDTAAIYAALGRASEFDVGVVFATDGRIPASDLTVLRDDRNFFPSYILAAVVRKTHLGTISADRGAVGETVGPTRQKWGLRPDYPMVAPEYSKRRSELALALGLGRKAAKEHAEAAPERKARKRKSTPKSAPKAAPRSSSKRSKRKS